MGFQLGDIRHHPDAGVLKGIQRQIACDCWFTAKGKSIPRMLKVMDEAGVLHTIENINVLYAEEKAYAGIQTVEHVCQIEIGHTIETVRLIFTKESCTWTMVKV